MPREYLSDGDKGFAGLNSRDNPATLPAGYLTKSENFRLDRGVATARRGLKKFAEAELHGPLKTVVGSGIILDQNGQELIVLLINDESVTPNVTRLYEFNTTTGLFSSPIVLPVVINSGDGVSIVQAIDKLFITRGHLQRPLVWDMTGGGVFSNVPVKFPNCVDLMFYQNRLVAMGAHVDTTDPRRHRDTICVSHFLEYDKWAALDAFTVNQGGNDEIVAMVPWTLSEFLILCRNSAFYLHTGLKKYITGDALDPEARLDTLSVDVGCAARRTAIQIGEGVIFLSDNGVYQMKPPQGGSVDGLKLLTLSDPLSAPIDDVIQNINKDYIGNSVAAYWNNRYYLAVPLGNSTTNNTILVYNFILKAWESVDTFKTAVDIFSFATCKSNKQRRLFAVDRKEGVLMLEASTGDEYGAPTGTPMLVTTPTTGPYAGLTGAYVPFTLSNDGFSVQPVVGEIVTRRFTADEGKDKRFSSVETDMLLPAGGIVSTFVISNNPDTETKIDEFVSQQAEDATRRNPARKIAYGLQVKFLTSNLQPSIRSNFVKFTVHGKSNANTK